MTIIISKNRWQQLLTIILFIVVCLSWGTTWLGIKIAVESVPPLTAAGLRFIIAFPLLLFFTVVRRERILFPRQHSILFTFITVGYFCIPYYLLNYGEQYVSSGLSSLLFSTMPVFLLLFSRVFLQEKILPLQFIGIIIGFCSLLMIIHSQELNLNYTEWSGVVAILSAAIAHALVYIITKQHGANISVITFNTLPIGIAGLALLFFGLISEQPDIFAISDSSWVALLYLGLVASPGGFIVYFFLLKRLNPVILSFIFIIFPVFAIAIDAWYEGSVISVEFVVFTALLLFGFAITKFPLEKLLRLIKGSRR
ncbi:TPA: DMT family transporter [Klebsiella michiganensis]|nr:DMT family transporter [Klebsiella michiganensis]HCB1847210.1 DMT family transporter [Klebsiella oxytoca]